VCSIRDAVPRWPAAADTTFDHLERRYSVKHDGINASRDVAPGRIVDWILTHGSDVLP
jgi:hypothetical protein